MPRTEKSLLALLAAAGLSARRFISDAETTIALRDLAGGSTLNIDLETCRGRSVLVLAARQISAVLAAIQLDGIARRIILAPPDLAPSHIASVITAGEVDIVLPDDGGTEILHGGGRLARDRATEWLLFTSGTSGGPKMVVHTLDSLTRPMEDSVAPGDAAVWSTFYDIRRYGGLQILLRALLGGGSMVLSDPKESRGDFLRRAGAAGVTHISGTPSHWRQALINPLIGQISPGYVRLSGEVADQAILNRLRNTFPAANIAHAFASTEAGVGFDVRDGLAGFPAALIGQPGAKVALRVQDGSLRIRSSRTASRYAGDVTKCIADDDGFVDTGDMVELRDDRYYFVGRREGLINVGGLKVHPEEVEAVVNMHPNVSMSRVHGRASPITGAIVVAEIVLKANAAGGLPFNAIKDEVLSACRRVLPAYKVPAMLVEVASLNVAASGKLMRRHA